MRYVIFLLLYLAAITPACGDSNDTNLLQNPGFEKGLATAQSCSATTNGGYNVGNSTVSTDGNINFASYNCGNIFYSSCDVELDSKPTWAY